MTKVLRSLVQELLQFLAGLEKWNLLGRNRYGRASLGVPPFLHPASPQPKTAEPTDLRLIAVLQGVTHTIEDRIDDNLCLPFRQCRDLFGYPLDDLGFCHIGLSFRDDESTSTPIRPC